MNLPVSLCCLIDEERQVSSCHSSQRLLDSSFYAASVPTAKTKGIANDYGHHLQGIAYFYLPLPACFARILSVMVWQNEFVHKIWSNPPAFKLLD